MVNWVVVAMVVAMVVLMVTLMVILTVMATAPTECQWMSLHRDEHLD